MSRVAVSRETSAGRKKTALPTIWSIEQWLTRVTAVAQDCGVALSEPQLVQLARYMALLQQWNGTYNLTALREPEEMLTHHLADCLVVVPPLLRHLDALARVSAPRVLDVGSGGGLPGVVLAVACEQLAVTCVDTVGKKAAFVRQVSAALALPRLRAEHARVETLRGSYEVVTSRAFASLSDFVSWTHHLLAPDVGIWVAMKGQVPDAADVVAMAGQARVVSVEPLHVPGLDAQRCLVWMKCAQ
jgi:16S rRNA (guanine527-N7)-methyltransferase